jgi:hypothetical protein
VDVSAREDEIQELDEGSWVYLSLQQAYREQNESLLGDVIDACEKSGWPAVTWSPPQREENLTARFFEGMDHAVEHAEMVVVLVNGSSSITDAELAFAYRHRRPVVALEIRDGDPCSSEVRKMLHGYDFVFTIEGGSAADCIAGLRDALADPSFAAMVDQTRGLGSV